MRAVDLRGIRFCYRGAEEFALQGVDFQVEECERVAVIGLTGAGKSSLLRCVNRLIPSSFRGEFEGRASLFGEDIAGKKPTELSGLVGMVFQDFESQLFSTTAEMDVAFGPENLGLAGDEIRERAKEAIKAVGMDGFERRDPATLSGGQKQRLAIASVLSLRPRLLCLDEPTTDLDPEGREEVGELLKSLCDAGMTVILAEHEPELLTHVDRVIGLANGRKVRDADAGEVLWDDEFLKALGVRPPDLVRIIRGLKLPERPPDLKAAAGLLKERGITMLPQAAQKLEEEDARARQSEGEEIIRVDGLVHRYGSGVEALRGVSLSICAGEFLAVLGRNGSGKTTLVKHINGLLRPTRGKVFIEGEDTRGTKVADLGRQVGFVFQDPDHQIFAGRVFDEVAFAPRNYGYSEAEVEARVEKALGLVGLSGCEDKDPFLLTKGERQRVALASVLSAEPPVIILDEPTTGLDYPAQRAVMDLLRALNQEGRTVIVITHALWVAAQYARRCVVMSEGEVLGDGPTRALLSDPGLLESTGLREPAVVELGKMMGAPTLTVEEFMAALDRGG